MVSIGEGGYLESTRRVLETAATIRRGVEAIPELRTLGDGLWIVAFGSTSPRLDIYRVMDGMRRRGWHLIGLQRPAGVHLCVTLRQTQPGVAERFLSDLRASVEEAKGAPAEGESDSMAPVYGMARSIPFRGVVSDLLERYMDLLYRP
jgi:hypothetical protein